jgi:hypothetical protein
VTIAVVAATIVAVDLQRLPDAIAAVPATSTIDRPAVDRVAPADAVVNVKAAFGVVGDGRADDTATIQRAISEGIGFTKRAVLYFPVGTYRVTKPLEWRDTTGTWSTGLTIMGQNRDSTIIKLDDQAAGYSDPTRPQAVIITGSQNADANGGGNQAFNNFIFDLTVDVGAGNPGADGIDYMVSNRGALRNIVIRAPADSGHFGISMNRRWPGPGLLEDVRIDGFDTGVSIGQIQYSMTMENLRLSGQRRVGISNSSNMLSIRRLISFNQVSAILNGGSPIGLLALLESDLLGGSRDVPAVVNDAGAYLRMINTSGYSSTVRDRGVNRAIGSSSGWSSEPPTVLFGARPVSLQLPILDAPQLPAVPLSDYAGVDQAGANPTDGNDDTAAIQRALDSGRSVVYLRAGRYIVSRTLTVPSSVKAVVGFEAQIDARTGAFVGGSPAAIFSVSGSSPMPVILSQINFWSAPTTMSVERPGSRPVALTDVHIHGLGFRGGAGQLFITDVEGGAGWQFTAGQEIWARQFDTEQKTQPKISNSGAKLWILGLKTEAPGTVIASKDNAQTELLGGFVYPVHPVTDGAPTFSSANSDESLVFLTNSSLPSVNYQNLVEATRGGRIEMFATSTATRRGGGTLTALFSDAS